MSIAQASGSIDTFLASNNSRLNGLVQRFAGHITHVDRPAIIAWLTQFRSSDWDLALRLIESVDYYPQQRILTGAAQLHQQALTVLGISSGFCAAAFGPIAGKSGGEMLYRYRLANHLPDGCLIALTDLKDFIDNSSTRFIFVDDFIGSGEQAVRTWRNISWSIKPTQAVLTVHVAYQEGLDHVEQQTGMSVVSNRILTEDDKLLSPHNTLFSQEEKRTLLEYCQRAGEFPQGYRNMQSNVVFYYRSPNNCISILRSNNPRWKGLFPRYV